MPRKQFTTSLEDGLLKEVKKLAVDLDLKVNDLLEEGMRYVLKRHGGQGGQIIAEDQAEYGRGKSGAGKARKNAPSRPDSGDSKEE